MTNTYVSSYREEETLNFTGEISEQKRQMFVLGKTFYFVYVHLDKIFWQDFFKSYNYWIYQDKMTEEEA